MGRFNDRTRPGRPQRDLLTERNLGFSVDPQHPATQLGPMVWAGRGWCPGVGGLGMGQSGGPCPTTGQEPTFRDPLQATVSDQCREPARPSQSWAAGRRGRRSPARGLLGRQPRPPLPVAEASLHNEAGKGLGGDCPCGALAPAPRTQGSMGAEALCRSGRGAHLRPSCPALWWSQACSPSSHTSPGTRLGPEPRGGANGGWEAGEAETPFQAPNEPLGPGGKGQSQDKAGHGGG